MLTVSITIIKKNSNHNVFLFTFYIRVTLSATRGNNKLQVLAYNKKIHKKQNSYFKGSLSLINIG